MRPFQLSAGVRCWYGGLIIDEIVAEKRLDSSEDHPASYWAWCWCSLDFAVSGGDVSGWLKCAAEVSEMQTNCGDFLKSGYRVFIVLSFWCLGKRKRRENSDEADITNIFLEESDWDPVAARLVRLYTNRPLWIKWRTFSHVRSSREGRPVNSLYCIHRNAAYNAYITAAEVVPSVSKSDITEKKPWEL